MLILLKNHAQIVWAANESARMRSKCGTQRKRAWSWRLAEWGNMGAKDSRDNSANGLKECKLLISQVVENVMTLLHIFLFERFLDLLSPCVALPARILRGCANPRSLHSCMRLYRWWPLWVRYLHIQWAKLQPLLMSKMRKWSKN